MRHANKVLVVVIVGAALLYVAAYYATVRISATEFRITDDSLAFFNYEREADYRFGGRAARIIFSPIHEIDRRFRRSVWGKDYVELEEP